MSGKSASLLNVEFQRFADGPLLAYVSSGHIAVRRKRALWVARAMAAAHKRALRRRLKEQRHGTS